MLTLPIKKEWYDMILSGEKKEEYREIKSYYTKRFLNSGLLREAVNPETESISIEHDGVNWVMFRNGYDKKSPSFRALVQISIGKGRTEWGATPGKQYYILHILSIE